jgi:hypothetical protein
LGGKDQAAEAYRKALKYNPKDTALKAWLDQYAPAPKTAPLPVLPPAGGAATPAPSGSTSSTRANPPASTQAQPAAPAPASN